MFTIKVMREYGYEVIACARYSFAFGDADEPNTLTLYGSTGEVQEVVNLDGDAVYIMNVNGKTIDTFHGFARSK